MNVYLDVVGTMLHTNQYGQYVTALGLEELLVALRPYSTFWLTTYCVDGNPIRAQEIMKSVLPASFHNDIMRIQPTIWSSLKTDAIDWTQPFLWLDDMIGPRERARFAHALPQQQFIEINLLKNPHQLHDIATNLRAV
jgi:hypothetical protein